MFSFVCVWEKNIAISFKLSNTKERQQMVLSDFSCIGMLPTSGDINKDHINIHIYVGFSVNMGFPFTWMNIYDQDQWTIQWIDVKSYEKLPKCSPKYHFAFPPAMCNSSSFLHLCQHLVLSVCFLLRVILNPLLL